MLNAAAITTEEKLAELLTALGFINESVSLRSRQGILGSPQEKAEKMLCRYVFAGPNKLPGHVLVSMEDNEFCVYWYSEQQDLFREWSRLSGDVPESRLHETILAAAYALNSNGRSN